MKGYAEKAWTAINLRSGDVPRSINLHVPVAVQDLPAACPGCTIAIIRFEGLSLRTDRILSRVGFFTL